MKYSFCRVFFNIKWLQTASWSMGWGVAWIFLGPVMQYFMGDGMRGLIGVEWGSSRMASSGVPAACEVMRAVLMVFTCLLMNPLDLEYWGDDVMWSICWFCMYLTRFSDKKGICCQWKCTGGNHIERWDLVTYAGWNWQSSMRLCIWRGFCWRCQR